MKFITVHKTNSGQQKMLYCHGLEDVSRASCRITADRIVIKRVCPTSEEKSRAVGKVMNNGSFTLGYTLLRDQEVPVGKIPVDLDESDEDTLVAYFEDMLEAV